MELLVACCHWRLSRPLNLWCNCCSAATAVVSSRSLPAVRQRGPGQGLEIYQRRLRIFNSKKSSALLNVFFSKEKVLFGKWITFIRSMRWRRMTNMEPGHVVTDSTIWTGQVGSRVTIFDHASDPVWRSWFNCVSEQDITRLQWS